MLEGAFTIMSVFSANKKLQPADFQLPWPEFRYNGFLIDGAVNNDVFGVSEQGTNGGRAGTTPISIEAIDQIVVQISPYDAALGNFTGGAINAITKSGTNQFHGSAYYVFRNQELAGKTPGRLPDSVKGSNFQTSAAIKLSVYPLADRSSRIKLFLL